MTQTPDSVHPTQIAHVVHLYSRAFVNDPLFTYFLPDPKDRLKKLDYVFEFIITGGLKYGEVMAMEDSLKSVAVLLPSDKIRMTLQQQIACGGLKLCLDVGLGVVHRLSYLHEFTAKLQKRHMPEKHRYLQLLGVDPEMQGQGYGGRMLHEIQRRLKVERLPLYLETENEKNLPFYTKRGFKVMEATQLPRTSIPVWALGWSP